jgi:hypothetical protein
MMASFRTAVVTARRSLNVSIGTLKCGSLPWKPPTGYPIVTEVTVTQTGIKATAFFLLFIAFLQSTQDT